MRILSLALLSSLVLGCAQEDDAARALSTAKISLADALKIAIEKAGGTPIVLEMTMEDGTPIYEIELADGKDVSGVTIDGVEGTAGRVMEIPLKESERATIKAFDDIKKGKRLTMQQAIEQAEAQAKGKAFEVDLRLVEEAPIFDIKVRADGDTTKVKLPVQQED